MTLKRIQEMTNAESDSLIDAIQVAVGAVLVSRCKGRISVAILISDDGEGELLIAGNVTKKSMIDVFREAADKLESDK